MSKVNQIQNGLRELSGGAFQKLADHYLHKKGYEQINPLGSVIGSDKVRKGTPDTLVPLPDGKYIFAEHTTQKKRVFEKIKGDLEKCFDETKTGVPVEKIEEVVFCHLSTLTTEENDTLREECQKRGVNLNIFGIGPISHDLLEKYPRLARDYLGVEVDTGQIVPPDEFVATYNRNRLATRLDTAFHFREEEIKQVLQGLEEGNLVIVSGRAGIGKSRLALECCDRFSQIHSEYEVRCVFNRGPDLFEDLRIHFSEPGHFLILVDDANRVSRFEYVVQLIQDQREDQRIKVVATVRDYALGEVQEAAQPYGGGIEVELQPLEEEQIKQLIEDEYGIRNYLYLDRIVDIAQGNPRLAIMAAEIAKRENTLQSIGDVSALYDEYYISIQRDLKDLGDRNLLKAAGIVAFFRAVDRSNEEMMDAITEAFGISSDAFWEAACRLNDLEMLDMYKDEVVRISDQVLATYLFYIAFFKGRVLEFSTLLNYFSPRLRHRLVDAIHPVLSAFDSKAIMEEMHPHVDNIWKFMEEMGDRESLLHLIDVFWFLKQTDTLLYIRDWIKGIEPKPVDLSDLEFEANSYIPSPSILGVLSSFQYADDSTFRMALAILFNYLVKRPEELPQAIHLLTDRFGFKHTSHARGFTVQQAVIDVLWKCAQNGKDKLLSKLFLIVAEQYLRTRFHTTAPRSRRTIAIINFQLSPTPELFELRRTLWSQLFQLYRVSALQEEVLSVLHNYSRFRYGIPVDEIVAQDAAVVLPLIESELEPGNYRHCSVVQDYLRLLEAHKVGFPRELRNRFRSETYALSEILFDDWYERRDLDLGYKEYQQLKRKWIEEHFDAYSFADYERFFEQCLKIQAELSQGKKLQLHIGVRDVLLALADRAPDLYIEVLEHYLWLGDPLRLIPIFPVGKLIQVCGVERASEILSQPDYPTKRSWLFDYHRSLPSEEVTAEHLSQLYALYREAERGELPHSFDFLLEYRPLDEGVVVRVTEIILEKAKADSDYASALSTLFYSDTEVNKVLVDLFITSLDLLKQAYLAVLNMRQNIDYNGQTFDRILDLDPNFILEYIGQMYEGREWLSRYDDTRDYSFLWMRDDYEELMTQVVGRIYEQEQEWSTFWDTYLETFFNIRRDGKANPEVKEKQDCFLKGLIKHRHNDPKFMKFVFSIIAQFPPERRHPFVALFLKYNRNFTDFEGLPLEPSSWSWSESAVPMLQGRVEYFESLLSLLNTVNLLQHRQYLERRIQGIRSEIEREKKRDFIED